MSRRWSERSTAERNALEAAFVARHGAALLLDGDPEEALATDVDIVPSPRRLPFAALYAALQRPGPLPAAVSRSLREDRRLRDDFALLLQRHARLHVPRAAAAAGRGALRRREVGGFTVRIVESRASRDQVYLLVELPEAAFRSPVVPNRAGTHDRAGAGPVREQDAAGAAPTDAENKDAIVDGARGESVPDTEAAAPLQLVVKTAAEAFFKRDLPPPEDLTIRLVMAADDPLVQAVGEPASELFLL